MFRMLPWSTIALLPLAACGPTQTAMDATRAAAVAQVNPTLSTSDSNFMLEAARGGAAEVQMGQLAERNGGSGPVRSFGQRMVTDHTKANQELAALAQRKQLTLPSGIGLENQQIYDVLAKLRGRAFDRAYAQDMVKDHQADVSAFLAEAQGGTDPDVKARAMQTLPVLEQHLRMAQALSTR
jgi:putative membrane protein